MSTTVSTAGNQTDGDRVVVRNSAGTPYVVVNSSGNIQVWKGNSTTPTSFSEVDAGNAPNDANYRGVAAAIDSSDSLHIVYFDDDTGMGSGGGCYHVEFNADGTTDTWGTPTLIGAIVGGAGGAVYTIAIAIDSNDEPHAVWRDTDTNMGTSYDTIYYANRVGGSWNSVVEVYGVTATEDANYFSLAIDANNLPVLAYRTTITTSVVYQASIGNANNATSFSHATLYTFGAASVTGCAVAVDSSGNHHFAYLAQVTASDLDLKVRTHNKGDSWTTLQTEEAVDNSFGSTNTSNPTWEPSIVCDGTDRYIFVVNRDDSDVDYYYDTGSGWTNGGTLETGTFSYAKAKWAFWVDNDSSGGNVIPYHLTGSLGFVQSLINSTAGAGQSFTGNGRDLNTVSFTMYKQGSPTGNVVAKLYAHSGTFGTSSVPTGTALAVSDEVDVTSFSSTTRVPFTFSTPYSLTDGTNYVVTIEGATGYNGSASNFVGPFRSNTDSASGNSSSYGGSVWSANSSYDLFATVFTSPAEIDYTFNDGSGIEWNTLSLGGGVTTNSDTITSSSVIKNTQSNTIASDSVIKSTMTGYTYLATVDSYAGSSDLSYPMYGGSNIIVGQSFTGNGTYLKQAKFTISRLGSPTGQVTATLYAHSGTYGSSSVGTGTALATSTTSYDISLIGTSFAEYAFDFDGTYLLANGTFYVIAVEFSGSGTAIDKLNVRADNTSPTHTGNSCRYTTLWLSNATDLLFTVTGVVYGITSDSEIVAGATVNSDTIVSDGVIQKLLSDTIASDSVIQETFSDTITSNSSISKSFSDSIVSDANIQSTKTNTITSDLTVSKTFSDSVVSDSVIQDNFSDTITSDSVINKLVSETILSDSIITKTLSDSITSDSEIANTVSATINSNSYIKEEGQQLISSDSVITKTMSESVVSDSVIVEEGSDTITSDSVIKKGLSDTIVSDSFINNNVSTTIVSDSFVNKTFSDTILSDSYVNITGSDAVVSDSFINKSGSDSIVSDSLINKTLSGTIVSDTEILVTSTVSDSIVSDSFISKSFSDAILSDSVISLTSSDTITSDSEIVATQSSVIVSNSYIKEEGQQLIFSDSVIAKTISDSITSDAVIVEEGSDSITSDSVINKTLSDSIVSDSLINTTSSDTVVSDSFIKTTSSDTITSDSEILVTSTVSDSITSAATISKSFSDVVTSDSVVSITSSDLIVSDSEILATQSSSIVSNSYIKEEGQQLISSDSVITKTLSGTIVSDSVIVEEGSDSIVSDSVINKTLSDTVVSDSLINKTLSDSIISDTVVLVTQSDTITSDTQIAQGFSDSIVSDSVIKSTVSSSIVSDSQIGVVAGPVEATVTSDSVIQWQGIILGTNPTGVGANSITSFTFTPNKNISLSRIGVHCRGDQSGADSTVKLTVNGIDSDTVNIGRSTDLDKFHKFTFSTRPNVVSGSETTVTITPVSNGVLVYTGSGDFSGWNVRTVG